LTIPKGEIGTVKIADYTAQCEIKNLPFVSILPDMLLFKNDTMPRDGSTDISFYFSVPDFKYLVVCATNL